MQKNKHPLIFYPGSQFCTPKMLVFLRFDLQNFGLESSGRSVGWIPTKWHLSKLSSCRVMTKNKKVTEHLIRVLNFERIAKKTGDGILLSRYCTSEINCELSVFLFIGSSTRVCFFRALIMRLILMIRFGRKSGGNNSRRSPEPSSPAQRSSC